MVLYDALPTNEWTMVCTDLARLPYQKVSEAVQDLGYITTTVRSAAKQIIDMLSNASWWDQPDLVRKLLSDKLKANERMKAVWKQEYCYMMAFQHPGLGLICDPTIENDNNLIDESSSDTVAEPECYCDNGKAVTGTKCPSNGAHKCSTCNSGYKKKGGKCKRT